MTSASASCLLSGSLPEAASQPIRGSDTPQPFGSSELIEGNSEEKPWMNYFSFLSPKLQDWLADGGSCLPKTRSDSVIQPATFEPFIFRPTADVKDNFIDNYMKRMAGLPASAWLNPPSDENLKSESKTVSGVLDDYMKKAALLPWLIAYRGVQADPVHKECEESDKASGIFENFAKRVANLSWLASEEGSEMDHGCVERVRNAGPECKEVPEGIEAHGKALSWLSAGDETSVPSSETFFYYLTKISQLPIDHWLLPRQDNGEASTRLVPKPFGDVIHNQSDESCNQMDLELGDNSELIGKTTETADASGFETADASGFGKILNVLNSLSINYWLSTPTQ